MMELVLQSSGERMSFSIKDSGSIGYSYGKNEIGAFQKGKKKVQVNERPRCKKQNYKAVRKTYREISL